jgi:protein-disulfide isomerase-like protein with CxxC motif
MSKQVRITAFTDPACTWCWGSEPVLRAVETRFGDQVHIRPVMGGLVKDIRAFMDTANGIGGDPERSNAQIAAHWLEASARHGMPVKTNGFRMFTDQDVSTWPMCEAYESARLQGEAAGGRYLRRLRAATAAEARRTNRIGSSRSSPPRSASISAGSSARCATAPPGRPSRRTSRRPLAMASAASRRSSSRATAA